MTKFERKTSGEVFYFTISNNFKLISSQPSRLILKIDEYEKDGYKFN